MGNPWEMYDRLIEGVPAGIGVRAARIGTNWLYVDAECGVGLSHVVPGGAQVPQPAEPHELQLHELAQWVKSWDFVQASIGTAALNAWYAQSERLAAAGIAVGSKGISDGKSNNPFDSLRERYEGKKVLVVGHFPNVEAMAEIADLTVLERNCKSVLDTPDSACEYILPDQDYAFITGTTITNKTAPRLLELARDVNVIMTGPSAVPCAALFEYGVNTIAGSAVVDAESAKEAILGGCHDLWRAGIKKYTWTLLG